MMIDVAGVFAKSNLFMSGLRKLSLALTITKPTDSALSELPCVV